MVDTQSADDSFAYWCAAHERILKLQARTNQKILILPFEGLFTDADSILDKLSRFLRLSNTLDTAQKTLSALDAPKTIGRHRELQRLNVSEANRRLLQRLRYDVKNATR